MENKNFPLKLYSFLESVEDNNISHIASWHSDGLCFRIHDPPKFIATTAPRWFEYRKYESFQRQLNIYGFRRITEGIDKNYYYHQYFVRGRHDLVDKIKRVPIKSSTVARSSNHTPNPDLDAATPLPASAIARQAISHSSGNQQFNLGSIPLREPSDHQLLTSTNDVARLPTSVQGTDFASSYQRVENDDIINQYLRDALTRPNYGALPSLSLPQLENNFRTATRPLPYDTDLFPLLQNNTTAPSLCPRDLLSLSLPPPLDTTTPTHSQLQRELSSALTNRPGLLPLSDLDRLTQLRMLAAQSQIEQNQLQRQSLSLQLERPVMSTLLSPTEQPLLEHFSGLVSVRESLPQHPLSSLLSSSGEAETTIRQYAMLQQLNRLQNLRHGNNIGLDQHQIAAMLLQQQLQAALDDETQQHQS